jgi:CelD/BcsL family acetyltransferase involved in cellulose biosynthesis
MPSPVVPDDFVHHWQQLFATESWASPFLSPLWVKHWLAVQGQLLAVTPFMYPEGEPAPRAMALLVESHVRRGPLVFRRLHLNTDGERAAESVYIENNALLCRPESRVEALQALVARVSRSRVHEFVVAGMDDDELGRFVSAFAGWVPDIDTRPSPYVDLGKVREQGGDLLPCLRANTRAQLRRALKKYEHTAPLQYDVARTPGDATQLLSELIALHELRWQRRGHSGAFASQARRDFHFHFAADAVPKGAAHLMRVRCGDDTVGVLYNLTAHARVNFYQSGFRVTNDPHLKPGWVSHYLAIRHFAELGYREYDFLASAPGESRYKHSLSTDERSLHWLTLARPSFRNALLRYARRLR